MTIQRDEKLIFISHEASLTGAPVLLLNLVRLLQSRGLKNFAIVLGRGGDLEAEFKKLGDVFILRPNNYAKTRGLIAVLSEQVRLYVQRRRLQKFLKGTRIVFANTIANGRLLKQVPNQIPIILYVHELAAVIDYFQRTKDTSHSLRLAKVFAYPSNAVYNLLNQRFEIPRSSLKKLDYFFPDTTDAWLPVQSKTAAKKQFAQKHNISDSGFWVGAMGLVSRRKGADLFIEVCEKVTAMDKSIKFVWIGDITGDLSPLEIRNEIRKKHISDNIFFTGKLPYNLQNLYPFDLFALTSREDPYPLVVLEAAYNRVPAICFSDSGGIVDFVENDCGWLVPGFSTDEMAKIIVALCRDKSAIEKAGFNAWKKAQERHSNPDIIEKQFITLLDSVM